MFQYRFEHVKKFIDNYKRIYEIVIVFDRDENNYYKNKTNDNTSKNKNKNDELLFAIEIEYLN